MAVFFFQRSFWPRGYILGGSTVINGMMWVRGSRHDFDMWSELGADGWSYKEILPYFIKSEDYSHTNNSESGRNIISEIEKTIVKIRVRSTAFFYIEPLPRIPILNFLSVGLEFLIRAAGCPH